MEIRGSDTAGMELADVAHEVLPNLWVSAMPAPDWDLDGWGVCAVVSLSEHTPPQAARRFEWGTRGDAAGDGRIVFLHWPIQDGDLPDPARTDAVVGLVVGAVRVGLRTLVHCQEGRNRSGFVAALAARELTGCSGEAALNLVRARRPGMLTNRAFATALSELAPLPA